MSVKPIPEGYHTITPYLLIKGSAEFLEFTKKAFGAKEIYKTTHDDGKIRHAELLIGDSHLMLSEAMENSAPTNVMLYLYVENVDDVYKQAINAGGISLREPANEFYGDRSAGLKDNFGIQWWIGTHIEDVSSEEMKKREEEWAKKQK
jgi:PhnB protein